MDGNRQEGVWGSKNAPTVIGYCQALLHGVKKLSSFWLAVILGGITEATFYGVATKFAKIGPCGPGNEFGFIFMVAHAPACRLASIFPEVLESYLIVPFMVLVLALVYWPIVALWRTFLRKRIASQEN
jgi:hypothetical protein